MPKDNLPEWGKEVANSLLNTLRVRDPYTYGHCLRVAHDSRLLAASFGLKKEEQDAVEYAAMFHDLGKMCVPDHILFKTSALSIEEEMIMRTHPVKSAEIIEPLCKTCAFYQNIVPAVRHHHEHFDGTGYPDGKKGENIPLYSRIILVADTYDAITTTRPYRKGLNPDYAYKELKKYSGQQFDPKLVALFLRDHPKWPRPNVQISETFINSHFKKVA